MSFFQEAGFENLKRHVATKTLVLHFGNQPYADRDFEYFLSIMKHSIDRANILTFSRNEHVHREIVSATHVDVRGYVGSTYANYHVQNLQNKLSCDVYQDGYLHVALLPHYSQILKDRDVVIISCFTKAENKKLAEKLCFNLIDSIQIPGQFVNDPYSMGYPLYPNFHIETIEKVTSYSRSGRVFLVAAGLLSKILCVEAAKNSSVAIDVGSVMDVWHGRGVRPYQHTEFVEKHRI